MIGLIAAFVAGVLVGMVAIAFILDFFWDTSVFADTHPRKKTEPRYRFSKRGIIRHGYHDDRDFTA